MAKKVFVGTWISHETRKKLKSKCAELDIYQGDVIGFLIENWINKKNDEDGFGK